MYISSRAACVRNIVLSATNGAVTLVILLIAPLGLAAVMINTTLIVVATYITATAADRIVRYLSSLPSNKLNYYLVLISLNWAAAKVTA